MGLLHFSIPVNLSNLRWARCLSLTQWVDEGTYANLAADPGLLRESSDGKVARTHRGRKRKPFVDMRYHDVNITLPCKSVAISCRL